MNTNESTVSRRSGGVGAKLALIVAGLLSIALVIFVLQNTVHTTINFLGWNADVAQGVSLLAAAVVGGIITLVVSAAVRLRRAAR